MLSEVYTCDLSKVKRMKWSFIRLIFLCQLFGLSVCGFADSSDYVQDFKIFKEILEEAHPSLNEYISADEWGRLISSASDKVKNVHTELEFIQLLSEVGHEIGDAHLSISLFDEIEKEIGLFVPSMEYAEGQLVFSKNNEGIDKGAKLVSINGVSSFEILKRLSKYAFSDAKNREVEFHIVAQNFERFMYYEFGSQAEYKIEYIKYGDDDLLEKNILGSKKGYFDNQRWMQESNIEYEIDDYGTYPKNLVPSVQIDETYDAAILRVPTFHVTPWFFKEILAQLFKVINEEGVSNLIVDVRDNGGGYTYNSYMLRLYLSGSIDEWWEYCYTSTFDLPYPEYFNGLPSILGGLRKFFVGGKQLDGKIVLDKSMHIPNSRSAIPYYQFRGNKFVLFNGRSCSAASEFAHFAMNDKSIITLGTESGASPRLQTAGVFADYILPNTRIKLHFGLISFVSKESEQSKGLGVIPDYEVEKSIEDVYYQTDPQMEKLLGILYNDFTDPFKD